MGATGARLAPQGLSARRGCQSVCVCVFVFAGATAETDTGEEEEEANNRLIIDNTVHCNALERESEEGGNRPIEKTNKLQ